MEKREDFIIGAFQKQNNVTYSGIANSENEGKSKYQLYYIYTKNGIIYGKHFICMVLKLPEVKENLLHVFCGCWQIETS